MQQMCAYEVSFVYYHHPRFQMMSIVDRSHRLFQILCFVY